MFDDGLLRNAVQPSRSHIGFELMIPNIGSLTLKSLDEFEHLVYRKALNCILYFHYSLHLANLANIGRLCNK